jgi:hypothetical protein
MPSRTDCQRAKITVKIVKLFGLGEVPGTQTGRIRAAFP